LDPALVLSLIEVESGFKPEALSEAGAVGLMQIMPSTAGVVLRDLNPDMDFMDLKTLRMLQGMNRKLLPTVLPKLLKDPFINLTLGVAYLGSLRDRYVGFHPYFPLAAYNLGPAKIDLLMSRKDFKPAKTKKYFEAIRQGVYRFKAYRKSA
jgi:soluble lytic murein transglycosylase